ncbi:MAG: amidase [Pseudonocardiales bacterium]|nr:amidase [Pseudonocardiales bacterium]
MSDLLTITGAAAALRAREVSASELIERSIAASDAVDEKLGSFLSRFQSGARAAAKEVDARLAAGEDVGPLAGIPLGIKDIITTVEGPTTAQSLVHDPSVTTGDAVVVQRLRAAGGVIMGKMTTMEFAVGLPDPDKPFPIPCNPWIPRTGPEDRVPARPARLLRARCSARSALIPAEAFASRPHSAGSRV